MSSISRRGHNIIIFFLLNDYFVNKQNCIREVEPDTPTPPLETPLKIGVINY